MSIDSGLMKELEAIAAKAKPTKHFWSEEEDDIMRKFYKAVDIDSMIAIMNKAFPGIKWTKSNLSARASQIGITTPQGRKRK